MKRYTLYSIMLLLLSACSYRTYQPVERVDDNLFGAAYASADSSSLASLSWRELFSDPYLQQLIDTALMRNTDLRTARFRVEQAEAKLQAERWGYLPVASLNAEGNISRHNGTKEKSFTVAPQASWEVDIFGKQTAVKREAAASVTERQAYAQAVQTVLVAGVASTYYSLLMLDEQLIIREEALQSWKETVFTLQAMKNAGLANETAVLQAEANRATLEADMLTLRKSCHETENELCSLLAQPPMPIERGTLAQQHFPDTLTAGIPLQLLSQRPDVRQAEAALAQSFYATNVARAAFYPSITLSGSMGWTYGTGTILNPATWLPSAIGSLMQPLLHKAENVALLKVAKTEQEVSMIAFHQTLLNAGYEVNNALTLWHTARQRQQLSRSSVDNLQEAVRKTELLMRHSSATYLEVLTVQQSLLEARQTLSQDKFDEINSIITLYHALGGGT